MIILSGPGRPQSEFACHCAGCGRSFYPTEEAVAEVGDLEPDVLFVPVCAFCTKHIRGDARTRALLDECASRGIALVSLIQVAREASLKRAMAGLLR